MVRRVEASIPSTTTEAVVTRLRSMEGVVSLALQPGASIQPPGDVLTIVCIADVEPNVLEVLSDAGAIASGSVNSNRPLSLVSPKHQASIEKETSELTWEEFGTELRHEANPTLNFYLLMVLSGAIAAVGLWVDTPIFVLAAILIAPGFEPLLRIPHGLLTGTSSHARLGALATLTGYVALALGAALSLLLLDALGSGAASEWTTHEWVRFWSSVSPTSFVLAALAGAAGAITISADRPVLTAGVLVALALIPTMSIFGMALASLDIALAAQALLRWSIDAAGVVLVGGAVILWKRFALQRRTSLAAARGRRGSAR